mmetsp:Transcript_41356/g.74834  ORF Transcript_41356/g.74834 Transcript_41356/m.74834 type:complete len:282 (+) Transcript_41356:1536-2381(+)
MSLYCSSSSSFRLVRMEMRFSCSATSANRLSSSPSNSSILDCMRCISAESGTLANRETCPTCKSRWKEGLEAGATGKVLPSKVRMSTCGLPAFEEALKPSTGPRGDRAVGKGELTDEPPVKPVISLKSFTVLGGDVRLRKIWYLGCREVGVLLRKTSLPSLEAKPEAPMYLEEPALAAGEPGAVGAGDKTGDPLDGAALDFSCGLLALTYACRPPAAAGIPDRAPSCATFPSGTACGAAIAAKMRPAQLEDKATASFLEASEAESPVAALVEPCAIVAGPA